MTSTRSPLINAAQELVDAAGQDAVSDGTIRTKAESFFGEVRTASPNEVGDAIRLVAGSLELPVPARAAELALICGALVERGADPMLLAGPLTVRLTALTESAAKFLEASEARMPKAASNEEEADASLESAMQLVEPEMPQAAVAWHALQKFWPAGVAIFSRSAVARAQAKPLRAAAGKIAPHHEAGHWLHMILTVLDNEPFLAIEPSTATGILGRMSGIVDNFQLNTLLMDGLPRKGFFSRRRVATRIADIARGVGPQQSNDTVTSVWNLYTWQAVRPDLTLPAPNDDGAPAHWVWNEGAPEDIPVFEGRRVILMGPPTYPRSWRSQRMFTALKAELAIDQKLTADEVTAWLKRMASARPAGK
jgi:hypothetical protein